jgi:hypothetical protein
MDHEEMLSWGERHLDRVEASAEDFMRHDPYISSCDPDYERRTADTLEYGFHVWPRVPPEKAPEHVALQIGDALHAFRVALDYLAVHVVLKAVPTAKECLIAFPIICKADDFASAKAKRLNGVTGDLLDVFESTQPYFGLYRSRPENDPLAVLNRLEQPHKHRRMLSTLTGPYEFIPSIVKGDPRHVLCVHVTLPMRPLGEYEKIEIARYRIHTDADGNPKAYVQGKLRSFVCFDREGPARGAPAITLLKEIRNRIRDDVFPAFARFV